MELTTIIEYGAYRVHVSRLTSGTWVTSLVAPGGIVDHVPGEFPEYEEALQAALRRIDGAGDQDRGGSSK